MKNKRNLTRRSINKQGQLPVFHRQRSPSLLHLDLRDSKADLRDSKASGTPQGLAFTEAARRLRAVSGLWLRHGQRLHLLATSVVVPVPAYAQGLDAGP